MTSPPSRFDDLVADDLLAPVITALDQHLGAHAPDQIERRVLLEHHDQVDRLERGQHLGARVDVLHRPLLALQAPHRGVVVEADHQPVAGGARPGQQLDVAGMQQVEAAVGEADAHSLPAPLREPLVEHRPVEHDLLLGRERGGRQNARAQLRGRDRGGAALADHDRGRRVGGAHGGLETGIGRQHRREHRDHGVARARHVAHLDRIGADMDRLAARRHQRHALLAARHQHGLAPDRSVELGGGGGDLGLARHRTAGHLGELLAVRRDQGGIAVDGKILSLGIDDDRLAELSRRVDQGAHDARRERALGVIGQHDRDGARQRRERVLDHALLGVRIERLRQLPVGAQQMRRMVLGDEADLARGQARAVDDQMRFDQRLGAQRGGERAAGVVVADHADEDAARAERGDVARHIAGAADVSSLRLTAITGAGASGEMRDTSP